MQDLDCNPSTFRQAAKMNLSSGCGKLSNEKRIPNDGLFRRGSALRALGIMVFIKSGFGKLLDLPLLPGLCSHSQAACLRRV